MSEKAKAKDAAKPQGSWRDVYVDHFPRDESTMTKPFDKGVGLDGYDRHEGTEVPTKPVLKGPKDKDARADPFEGH